MPSGVNTENFRVINEMCLTGTKTSQMVIWGHYNNTVTAIPEGVIMNSLVWNKPFFNKVFLRLWAPYFFMVAA